eukprot:Phypoly_transcript_15932.p1 GENE.Phypoly_transcript_15932~~Phypoly_transcript_15932.p1  ORF type:complete len:161 (+),score=13.83 Phypoly_transcript_15932:409-891(+)
MKTGHGFLCVYLFPFSFLFLVSFSFLSIPFFFSISIFLEIVYFNRIGILQLCRYSITSKFSFTQVAQFHEDILQVKDSTVAPIVIVGNKCDMEEHREVAMEMGKKYADKFNIPFFETSGKTRLNVAEAFQAVVRQILKYTPEKTRKKYKKDGRRTVCVTM